jgi:hypothetical protein
MLSFISERPLLTNRQVLKYDPSFKLRIWYKVNAKKAHTRNGIIK